MTKANEDKCDYCNSVMKISKKGNLYCSNICWEKEPWKTERYLNKLEHEAFMETHHGDWGCRDGE